MSDIDPNKELFNRLNKKIMNFNPEKLDLTTTEARLQHTGLNVSSINIQTMALSIVLVILVTIAFIAHLKE